MQHQARMLLSLAKALSQAIYARHGVAVPVGEDLFVYELPPNLAGPAAVMRIYGGPPPETMRRHPVVSIQVMVHSQSSPMGMELANLLFDSLHWPDQMPAGKEQLANRPRSHWQIDGYMFDASGQVVEDPERAWMMHLIDIHQHPGVLGRDAHGRHEISFNFTVTYSAANPIAD